MTRAKFVTEGVFQPDGLVHGNAHTLIGRIVTIAAGQVLKRGSVLGKVTTTNGATAAQADGGNAGAASVGTVTVLGGGAQEGQYAVAITAAKNGETPAEFIVTAPDGSTAIGITGAAFDAFGVSFTLTEGTNPNEAEVGDSWTFSVSASAGEYRLSASGASDGSQTPDGVLAEDVDSSTGDASALVYLRGDFSAASLHLGAGHTVASITDALRGKGIAIF